jgi:hypothetical protein
MIMPRYKNNSGTTKVYNSVIWETGQERDVMFFVPAEIGLNKISDAPRVPPMCLDSGVVSIGTGASVSIDIPFCDTFKGSFVCMTGQAEIRQNYADAEAVTVAPGVSYEIMYKRALVEKLILSGVSGCSVAYDIERVV